MAEHIKVEIPVELYKAVEEIVLQTEHFQTPSEVVCHILRQFAPQGREGTYSPEEEKEIKKRLQDLGYLG